MSQTSLALGNTALPINDPFESLKTPATERALTGEGKITIGGITSKLGYMVRELADDLTEVAVTIGEGVGSAVRAIIRRPAVAVTAATLGLASVPGAQSESRAAFMNDGVTRPQMTSNNPSLNGFFASGSTFLSGIGATPNNSTVTHLWGQYYAVAAHEVTNGLSIGSIYAGRDYRNNPGNPIGITRIDISPYSDLAIITADTADNTSRDPNSRLVGIVVAQTGGRGNAGTNILNSFSSQLNLDFINQITGTNITESQILAGQSIIAAPHAGQQIWSEGYGAWGTPSTGTSNPDGLPGQWQGVFIPNGGGLGGNFTDPTFYFATNFVNDGGLTNGPMNGLAQSIDSGAVGIVIVPEPGTAGLVLTSVLALAMLRPRQTKNN